jgi:pimeloyl-ACP methyl ester carboxylesterase
MRNDKYRKPGYLAFRLVRQAFRYVGPVFPRTFGRWGIQLWGRTYPSPWRPWEREILDKAVRTDLTLGQERIATYTWGNSEQSVLIAHGWNSRASHFKNIILQLHQRGYRVIGFDAVGHGHSSGSRTSIMQYLAAMHAVHRHYGPFQCVIGHSFGGLCLPRAIIEGIETEKTIILCAPDSLQWVFNRFTRRLGMAENTQRAMAQQVESLIGADCWNKYAVVHNADKLQHIPALLIYDRDDPDVSHETGRSYADAWPGAQLTITSELGHHRVLRDKATIHQIVSFIQGI